MKPRLVLALTAFCLFSVAITISLSDWIQNTKPKSLGTILHWSTAETDDRFFLILPWWNETGGPNPTTVNLMNRDGTVFHSWTLERLPMHARLLENGNLLAIFPTAESARVTAARGECDEIGEFDWGGKKIWSFKSPALHHDLMQIDDDRIATLQNEKLSEKDKAVYLPDAVGTAFGDSIVVIKKSTGEVTWRWSIADVMPQLADRIVDRNGGDIAHINSLQYIEKNPWSSKPAFLVSVRQLSVVLAVEIETKKILWSSPTRVFRFQHDAHLLEDGNILVFDNGIQKSLVSSRVVLLDPKTNQTKWVWEPPFEMFAVPFMGGAQNLPNGHVLITNSLIGQVFEVTPDKRIVWNFIGAFDPERRASDKIWWPGTRLYRVLSYPKPKGTVSSSGQIVPNFKADRH